jgi:hypothetical protein
MTLEQKRLYLEGVFPFPVLSGFFFSR